MVKLPKFVSANCLGCLCSSDQSAHPSGATVFYAVADGKLYIVTHAKSMKAKHISQNPEVCFVVANTIAYEQAQIYCTARIVPDPGTYLPLLAAVTASYSLHTSENIPYMDIRTQGDSPVVIELVPKACKYFRAGNGLVEMPETASEPTN